MRCLSIHHAHGTNTQIPSAVEARAFTLGGGEPLLAMNRIASKVA